MLWIILTILCGVVGIAALYVGHGMDRTKGENPLVAYGISGVVGLLWIVASFFMSLHTVGQRQVGVVYSFSGTVQGKKDPGVVMTFPWQHLKTEHVGTQVITFDFGPENSAVSKDQQDVYAHLSVNLNVEPKDVVRLYKTVGSGWKHIVLEPRVPQDFKEVTATYLTTDIPANREEIRTATRDRLRAEMARGNYGIDIQDVFLTNLDYSASYKRAIELKQVQVQKSLAAKAKVDQAQYEADQVKKAADGEAYAIRVQGSALRANPEVLRLRAIEKLNPNASVVICTGRTCPAFLPSGLIGGK